MISCDYVHLYFIRHEAKFGQTSLKSKVNKCKFADINLERL